MNAVSRMFTCLAALVAAGVQAGSQGLEVQHYSGSVPSIELSGNEVSGLWEGFKLAFERRADEVFADEFHPLNVMNWKTQQTGNDFNHLRKRTTSAGLNTFSRSFMYSVRDAAVDLPILSWFAEHQGILADFIWDSLDSVEEESVAPLDPSYRLAERTWWQQLSESRQLRYGIRPLRTDPYAFLSLGINAADKLLVLGNLRYHFRNFTDHRFELALSVPLPSGFSIDMGTSYQFGQNSDERRAVVKLFKAFKSGGILHVGFEVQDHPSLFAGIALPW